MVMTDAGTGSFIAYSITLGIIWDQHCEYLNVRMKKTAIKWFDIHLVKKMIGLNVWLLATSSITSGVVPMHQCLMNTFCQ